MRPGTVLEIGPKLKAARKRAGMSLRDLGRRTGFSASFLSQVELGQASPSLASLEKLATGLGVEVASLFAEAPGVSSPMIQRHDENVVRSGWSRATLRVLLAPWPGQPVSALLVTLEPGGQSAKTPRTRAGRILAFCVSGSVALVTPDGTFRLSRGDSISYATSTVPSLWRNDRKRGAELLLVSLPE